MHKLLVAFSLIGISFIVLILWAGYLQYRTERIIEEYIPAVYPDEQVYTEIDSKG